MNDESEMEVTLNMKGLDALLRALDHSPTIRVGILGGNKTLRYGGTHAAKTGKFKKDLSAKEVKTNAEIGAIHEFGDEHMPQRSFLRVPISEKLQQYLELSRAFDEDTAKRVIAEGSVMGWMKKIAVICEQIVSDAFDSRGFGRWKPSNMTNKKNHQTLVETQQLRNSITADVKV